MPAAAPEVRMVTRCLQTVSVVIEALCFFMFVVMCASLTIQITGRYCFDRSFFWAEELARYSMVWIVFLGAVAATHRHAHTRIEYFVGLLSQTGQRLAYLLVTALCVLFLGVIAYASSNMLWLGSIMKSTAMGLPMILVYSALPACSVLMILYLVWDCFTTLRGAPQGGDATC